MISSFIYGCSAIERGEWVARCVLSITWLNKASSMPQAQETYRHGVNYATITTEFFFRCRVEFETSSGQVMRRRLGWVPPKSPVGIIQEDVFPNEWHALVQCILLNCTSRKQVEKIWLSFASRFPTPESLVSADIDDVKNIVSPLGFKDRRSVLLKKMTQTYLGGQWNHVTDLPGIGVYGGRMWDMLFRGELGDEPPKDHALVRVWEWMKAREKG